MAGDEETGHANTQGCSKRMQLGTQGSKPALTQAVLTLLDLLCAGHIQAACCSLSASTEGTNAPAQRPTHPNTASATGITNRLLLKNQGRCRVEKHINHTSLHTCAQMHIYMCTWCVHAHTANTHMHVHIYTHTHMCTYLQAYVHTEKMNNSFITHPIGMKEPGVSPQHSVG